MKKLKFLFLPTILALAFGLMLSCSDKDESSSSGYSTSSYSISGYVQKGPYVQGTEITVRELYYNMTPSGRTFTGTIDDNTGTFSAKGGLSSPYVELSADGYYFNEVSGSLSSAKLTLSALSVLTDSSSVNVNLMTHLEKKRVEYLIERMGLPFYAAKTQAQTEILKIFNIENVTLGNSESLDISKSGDGNAVLLAISAILQSDKTEAELTELLSTINTDIRTDGTLDSTNTKATLVTAMEYVKPRRSTIRSNIESRYSNLGISATIPAFESYAFKLDTTSPSVSSTSPADSASSVDPAKDNTTISVTFSEIIDNSTITTNTANTTCSGTLQVSSDNFSSCIQMSAVPLASNSDSIFSISPTTDLVYGSTYKIKVTTDVKDLAGNNLTSTYLTSTGFSTPIGISKISAGLSHSCAIYTDSTVKCWGSGNLGDLGDGNATTSYTPVSVSNITNPIDIVASCAVISGGTMKCWGDNGYGQVGDGTTTQRNSPVDVSGITNASKVFSSRNKSICALLDNSSISCWGPNWGGQLGDGTTTNRSTPQTINNISTATDLALAEGHTCALLSDGTVKCWGWNMNGQLGDGSTTNRTSPVTFSGVSNAKDIAVSERSTCILFNDGTVKCIGKNNLGQLGDGTTNDRTSLVSVIGITSGTKIVGADWHYCVLLSDHTIKCWGGNYTGQLGDGSTSDSSTPVTVSGISNAMDISAFGWAQQAGEPDKPEGTNCALLSDKGAKCWGYNNRGQVGTGSNSPRIITTPTLLYGL